MDSMITAAARALAVGDPLGALKRIALREDAPALALRGIAMAQLGDFARARDLVRRAARAFGPKESLARARCILAEAEIALAARDLRWPTKTLEAARATLETHGDRANAAHARYLQIRRLLLIGRLADVEQALAELDATLLSPPLRAAHELIVAGIALRRLQAQPARAALARAEEAARQAGIPALLAEVASTALRLSAPAARLLVQGKERWLMLEEVATLLASEVLVIDACRHGVREAHTVVALAKRPVLFAIARRLGEAWPADVSRTALIEHAFRTQHANESHRARLRVEMGRLRKVLRSLAEVSATPQGFVLTPLRARDVVVLTHPVEVEHAELLALLADGESWSSSALALALGASQRTVQRMLDSLAATSQVQAFGRGPARRWTLPPLPAFTTPLLLTDPVASV